VSTKRRRLFGRADVLCQVPGRTRFSFERFLHRFGKSEVREGFVLKGAMLLRLWSDQPYRATRDLDLLRRGEGTFDAIQRDLRAICAVPVEPDAVRFDAEAIRIEAIRAEDEYAGTRATLPARCGKALLSLQIDMGLGDSVWPAPSSCVHPALAAMLFRSSASYSSLT